MKPSNQTLRSWLLALSAGTVLSSPLTVQATEYTWDNAAAAGIQTGSGNWSTTGTLWTIDSGVTRIGWPSTGADNDALIAGPVAADFTLSLNSTDILLDDLTSGHVSNFCYLAQVSGATVRTLTLTGGTYNGTGTTGSQFTIAAGGNVSFAGTVGTTQFKLTGTSDMVKLGDGGLFFATINNDFTGNIYVNQGGIYCTSSSDTSFGNSANDIFLNNGGALGAQAALTIGSGRTITLGASGGSFAGNSTLTVQGQITGAGSLTKTSSGTLEVGTASNYAGTTTISAGTIRLLANGTIPSTSNLAISGSGFFNIRNTGNWVYNGAITGDGTGSITPNSGTNATLAGNISGLLSISASTSGTNATISGNISGANTVNVTNAGASLRLSGTNTYSGATTVNSGTLIVNGNNSGATAAVAVSASGILAGSGTIGSATTITGTHAPGGDIAGVQTFTSGIDYAAASILSVNLGTNSAAPAVRGAFPLGHGGANVTAGTVNIDPTATGRVALNSATGDLNLSNTFWNSSQQWLVVDVKGTATAADSNAPVSATTTLNGSAFNTAAYGTFSFSRAAGSTAANSVWLQWTPATPPTWTGTSGTSWATAGNWTPAAPSAGSIVRFHTSSTSNLATVLGANYDLLGLAVINPSGPVSIGGANTLTVGTGGLDLAFATQNLTITAPVVLSAAQSWSVGSGRTLSVNGGVSGAFPLTVSGAGTVSLGAAMDPLVAMTVASGSTLKMGVSSVLSSAATAINLVLNGKLDLNGTSQSINALGGSGIVDNAGGGASVLTVGNNDAAFAFGGILQDTSGTLAVIKTGSGGLTLTGTNDFSGGFTNNGIGAVTPNSSLAFGTGPVVSNAGTIYGTSTTTFANTLTLNNSTLRIGGGNSRTITWNGPVTATGTSGINADGGTAGITLGSTLNIAGATFSSFANGTTHTITGNVSGAGGNLSVTGGTLQLSGTGSYSGTTTISSNGVLRLLATGTISNSSNVVINTVGNLNVRNTGNWVYTGTISGDGTGSINLNTGTNATLAGGISGVASVNVATLDTNAVISGAISGAASVNVQLTGATLSLSGNNSYSGATTLTGGTLALAASNVLPDATVVSIGNATLNAATFTDTAGILDPTSTATIQLGSGAALAFADSSAVDWTGGTLNITGTFVSGSSLRFGTTSGGLLPAQLALITVTGVTGPFTLNATGYLTAPGVSNTAPTISDIVNLSVPSGGNTGALAFTVGDLETAAGSLIVTGSSSNTSLVPHGNIVFGGSGASRTVTVTPVSGLSGTATITVTVGDGSLTASDTFVLTVTDNYLSWATANSVTGGANGDSDNDGVKNLVEYALVNGGERGVYSGNTIIFTKRGVPYGSDVTYDIESSTLLTAGSWTTLAKPPVVESASSISYTFTPGSPVKNFARLKVTAP